MSVLTSRPARAFSLRFEVVTELDFVILFRGFADGGGCGRRDGFGGGSGKIDGFDGGRSS